MTILAHRGLWKNTSEKNTVAAIKSALVCGYGFESDIRDFCGNLVISHNVADATCRPAEEVFSLMEEFNDRYCFAVNIKSDGLKDLLLNCLKDHNLKNYFTFDMSVPQMVEYAEAGICYFTRQSEYEKDPVLYEKASGVWIDGFADVDWITEELLERHIDNGKSVCIVSPELHGRTNKDFWKRINEMNLDFSKVMLCTDTPDDAKIFFGGWM